MRPLNPGASHLRGRTGRPEWRQTYEQAPQITVNGVTITWRWARRWVKDVYRFEVVNTRTGRVVYSDNAYGFEDAVASCSEAVYLVRQFWAMSVKSKEIK